MIPTLIDRVFLDDPLASPLLSLIGPEAHHLTKVRRAAVGSRVEVFNGRGLAFLAEVQQVARDQVLLRRLGEPLPNRRAPFSLTIATAVPKGDRFDWLVEKAVELGVDRLRPLRTARSVVDPRAAKLDRLRRSIVEASKQCGRNELMRIDPPLDWHQLIATDGGRDRRVAHPGAESLAAHRVGSTPATIAIGPEGGLTDEEVAAGLAAGWRPFGLGSSILRIETAALAAAASMFTLAKGDATWSAEA